MSETKFKHGIETPSKITFESYGVRYTWETDHSDLTLDEVLDAFYKLLIAHGFNAEGVLKSMKCYAEEELEIMSSCEEIVEQTQQEEANQSIRHNNVQQSNIEDPFEGHTPYFEMHLNPTDGCSD